MSLCLGLLVSLAGSWLGATPAQAAGTGHITGTVTASSGAALPNVTVTVYAPNEYGYWNAAGSTTTGSGGTYDLSGLGAGTYRVGFSDPSATYAPEFWDDAIDVDSATDIAVPDGGTLSGRDARLEFGGQIAGRVTDSHGSAIACCHVSVTVYRYNSRQRYWQYVTSAFPDSTGSYTARGLAAATYRIGFTDTTDGYLAQFWNGKPDVASADDVIVTSGATASGKDAHLVLGGHVSGMVTATGGVALAGINVEAYRQDGTSWTLSQGALTDANGRYDMGSLVDGTYRVHFSDYSGRYLPEYWNDAATADQATTVVVTGAGTVGGVSPVLARAGRILGTVTGPGGTALPQIGVQALQRSTYGGWEYAAGATTNSDGSYTVGGLRTGTYRLQFSDPSGRFVTEYYNDAATLGTATDVEVSTGADTAGRNARLAPASHVTGVVTGPAAAPAPGVLVTAYLNAGTGNYAPTSNAYTDANGHYDLGGLSEGTYSICFSDPQGRYFQECWNDKADYVDADPVSVASDTTVPGIDAELTPGAQIAGTVTGPDSLSPYSVYATAYQKSGQSWFAAASGYVQFDGTYRIGPLKSGTYRVGFSDSSRRYAPQFWDGATTLEKAQAIVVSGTGTVNGIDARLRPGSHITGQVTGAEGGVVSGARVVVYGYDRTYRYWRSLQQVTTSSTGAYDLGGLAAGVYRVGFDDPSGQHLGEYWDDQDSVTTATDIKVGSQSTVSGKNAVLADAAHITGVVTGSDGSTLGGVEVYASHQDPVSHQSDDGAYAVTGADGTYDLGGLRAGAWRLSFDDPTGRHLGEFWNNKASLDAADPINVTTGVTTPGKDAQLATASHITGTITDQSGRSVSDERVYAYSYDPIDQEWEYVADGTSDAAGAYDVAGLAAGTYRLWFVGDAEYAQQYWKNQPTLDQANDIKVGRQAVVSGKNVRLAPAGHVTGTVSDRLGQPLSYIGVTAYAFDRATQTWEEVSYASSDASGHYDIGGLPANTYRIGYRDYGTPDSSVPRYALQFWNGKPDVLSADDVVVPTGSTVPGTDARLDPQARISGQVTDAAGHGVDTDVDVFRKTASGTFEPYTYGYTTSAKGAYAVNGLPVGTYRLEFEPDVPGFADEYYDDATTLATATDIVVSKTGQQVKGKDAVLAAGSSAASSAEPQDGVGTSALPGIEGAAQVGSTLRADVGPPVVGEPPRFQWQVGGVDVLGATGPTYQVRPQDVGQSVTVRVLPRVPGAGVTATSPPTPLVRPGPGSVAARLDQHDGAVAPQPPALQPTGVRP